jgi:hypothetical protein
MTGVRLAASLVAALLLAGCGGSDGESPTTRSGDRRVVELPRLAAFTEAFAQDRGRTRVLLLLSPT